MKYEITDQVTYRTIYFTIEADNGKVYNVSVAEENEWKDNWRIMDEDGNEIDYDVDLCDALITLCEESISK
jgi:hypothetical protein